MLATAYLHHAQPIHDNFPEKFTEVEDVVPSDSSMSNGSFSEISVEVVSSNSNMCNDSCSETSTGQYLQIIVEPIGQFRYRYKSEGEKGSHGGITGVGRTKTNKKIFPTVKLVNYHHTHDNVVIKASLYSNDKVSRPHIFGLAGKNCTADGVCIKDLSQDYTAQFESITIQSKKKEEVTESILENKKSELEKRGIPYDLKSLRKQAQAEAKKFNLHCVRLCFEAFNRNNLEVPLCRGVLSNPIYNLKSPLAGDLRITRLSSVSGSCSGGEEIILLCEKIKKDDIQVRLQEKENDSVVWEDFGTFNSKADVHHQVAIIFKTPPYKVLNAEKFVWIDLYRPSDDRSSEPRKFRYIPDEKHISKFSKKRKLSNTKNVMEVQVTSPDSDSWPDVISPMETSNSLQLSSPGNSSVASLPTSDSSTDNTDTDFYFDKNHILSPNFHDIFDDNSILTEEDLLNLLQGDIFYSGMPEHVENDTGFGDIGFSLRQDKIMTDAFDPMCKADSIQFYTEETSQLNSISTKSELLKHHKAVSYMDSEIQTDKIFSGKEDNVESSHTAITADGGMMPQSFIPFSEMGCPLQENICDRRISKDFHKKSKTNTNFEHFRESIGQILKNREEKAYLHCISNLISSQDENGNTFLHLAILEQSNNFNLITTILDTVPQIVGKKNEFHETVLHLATKRNMWKVLLLLLVRGGNPSLLDQDGNNCFHLAAKFNYSRCMKVLLCPKLKPERYIQCINALNYDGSAPLHLSIMSNAEECMQLLLQAKADVNVIEGKTGRSPLHLAIEEQPNLIASLISRPDIDLKAKDFRGYTPLHSACDMKGVSYEDISMQMDDDKTVLSFLRNLAEELKMQKSANDEFQDTYYSCNSNTSSDTDSDQEDLSTEDLSKSEIAHCDSDTFESHQPHCINENNSDALDEKKLCDILDTNSNWKKLGEFIGMDESTLKNLGKFSSSPSKVILKKFKNLYPEFDRDELMNFLDLTVLKDVKLLQK